MNAFIVIAALCGQWSEVERVDRPTENTNLVGYIDTATKRLKVEGTLKGKPVDRIFHPWPCPSVLLCNKCSKKVPGKFLPVEHASGRMVWPLGATSCYYRREFGDGLPVSPCRLMTRPAYDYHGYDSYFHAARGLIWP